MHEAATALGADADADADADIAVANRTRTTSTRKKGDTCWREFFKDVPAMAEATRNTTTSTTTMEDDELWSRGFKLEYWILEIHVVLRSW